MIPFDRISRSYCVSSLKSGVSSIYSGSASPSKNTAIRPSCAFTRYWLVSADIGAFGSVGGGVGSDLNPSTIRTNNENNTAEANTVMTSFLEILIFSPEFSIPRYKSIIHRVILFVTVIQQNVNKKAIVFKEL